MARSVPDTYLWDLAKDVTKAALSITVNGEMVRNKLAEMPDMPSGRRPMTAAVSFLENTLYDHWRVRDLDKDAAEKNARYIKLIERTVGEVEVALLSMRQLDREMPLGLYGMESGHDALPDAAWPTQLQRMVERLGMIKNERERDRIALLAQAAHNAEHGPRKGTKPTQPAYPFGLAMICILRHAYDLTKAEAMTLAVDFVHQQQAELGVTAGRASIETQLERAWKNKACYWHTIFDRMFREDFLPPFIEKRSSPTSDAKKPKNVLG